MPERWTIAVAAGAFVIGLPLAFFGPFAIVFADGGLDERLASLAVAAVVYFLLAGLFGGLARKRGWLPGLGLGLPALLLLAWYTTQEPGNVGLHLLVVAAVLAASALGGLAGEVVGRRLEDR